MIKNNDQLLCDFACCGASSASGRFPTGYFLGQKVPEKFWKEPETNGGYIEKKFNIRDII